MKTGEGDREAVEGPSAAKISAGKLASSPADI
jgi:hypothetical protein